MATSDRVDFNSEAHSAGRSIMTKDTMHSEGVDVINPMPRLTELNKSETYNFKENLKTIKIQLQTSMYFSELDMFNRQS